MDMNLMTLNMQIGSKVTWHLIGVYKENVSKDRYSQAIAQRRQIRPLYFPAWRQSQSGLWATAVSADDQPFQPCDWSEV
jgi:hypothetical protein